MSANDIQIGGSHYNKHKDETQHWDWVIDLNLPYTLGCATKYLFRWRDKGGIEDLKKARHYIQKTADRWEDIPNGAHVRQTYECFAHNIVPNYVGVTERLICEMVTGVVSNQIVDFKSVLSLLDSFIREESSKADTDVYATITRRIDDGNYGPVLKGVKTYEDLENNIDQPTARQLHPG